MAMVCVWSPRRIGKEVGHSSILLDKARKPAYVSWWPNGGVNLKSPSTGHHQTPPYRKDVELEMGNPTDIIPLGCLDEELAAEWWRRVRIQGTAIPFAPSFQPRGDDYNLFTNNCSDLVLLAMRVGGSEKVCLWTQGIIVTPWGIRDYARQLQTLESFQKQ